MIKLELCIIDNYCMSCGHKYKNTRYKVDDKAVKCDKCDGYVISPSGKQQCTIRSKVNVFMINGIDGVMAESAEQALAWYQKEYDGYYDLTLNDVKEFPLTNQYGDELGNNKKSLETIINEEWEGKPFVCISTEY